MLVSDRSTWRKVELPHEPGQVFTLRLLTDDEYQAALDAKFEQTIAKARAMGSELTRNFQAEEVTPEARQEAMVALHPATAIKFALVAWSYEAPCDDEHKAQLDRVTSDYIIGVIREMNGPRPVPLVESYDTASSKDGLQDVSHWSSSERLPSEALASP